MAQLPRGVEPLDQWTEDGHRTDWSSGEMQTVRDAYDEQIGATR
ncbi:hypothetical protein SAMN05421505_1625 [Sinosporangium album]|uniref:Uncharacterized protein n=1 Tax=Sinosporangium album TaxID=504805 RepID=A0A1G8L6C5_9ACTN|nr:hypothetical protein [Sinosporangium album]SDI51107.1 hypothetical protein SAMN05421505_1625 [Sinosporangium album]